jgi:hypothetical protein
MQITCKQCGADVSADNINIDSLVAKCSFCNAVFRFDDQLEPAQKPPAPPHLKVSMPKGIEVQPTRSTGWKSYANGLAWKFSSSRCLRSSGMDL